MAPKRSKKPAVQATIAKSPGDQQPDDPQARFLAVSETFQGPLPHPRILEHYNEIAPGAAEKIINVFVKQTDHRMDLERKVIEGDAQRASAGIVVGGLVATMGLIGAVILGVSGHEASAAALGVADIGTLAGIFVYGSQKRRQERDDKNTAVPDPKRRR